MRRLARCHSCDPDTAGVRLYGDHRKGRSTVQDTRSDNMTEHGGMVLGLTVQRQT